MSRRLLCSAGRWLLALVMLGIVTWRVIDPAYAGESQWTTNGPPGSEHVSIVVLAPTTPTTLYAVTDNRVLKSENGGAHWTSVSAGLPDTHDREPVGLVYALAIAPLQPTTLYAGLSPDGVFKSTDGGQSWGAMNTGLTNTAVRDLTLDPRNPTTLYAATDGGVYMSTDSGAHWTALNTGLTTIAISRLALNSTGSTLYAGSRGDGVSDLQIPSSP